MFKNYFSYFPFGRLTYIKGKSLSNFECVNIQPKFAFHVSFLSMNMNGFIPSFE